MLILFGIFEIELNITADVIVGLIDGKSESLSFFVSVLEYFLFLFFVKNDINVDTATQTTKEAGDFILN